MEALTEYRFLEAYLSRRRSRVSEKTCVFLQGPNVSRNANERTPCSLDAEDYVAEKLTDIVDSVPLAPEDIVTDNCDSDFIHRLVELLKESGDKLNEEIMRDHELSSFLQRSFSYSIFENLASAFIRVVVPESGQKEEVRKKKAQIAWTFEMTSRLSALHLQPLNRSMGFGACYLHQHFAPWIEQHGGWEKVFNNDESDEEIQ